MIHDIHSFQQVEGCKTILVDRRCADRLGRLKKIVGATLVSRLAAATLISPLCFALASCTSNTAALHGPNPVISASELGPSTDDYLKVRQDFVRWAGYSGAGSVDWFQVTTAGFNYVDGECRAYFGALEAFRRSRDGWKAGIGAVGTAASSVLSLASASNLAIGVTAQAFGLASQLTDITSASILYAMDPADLQLLVRREMDAYRRAVEAAPEKYNTSNAAMAAIGGYLNVCLPVSIEARVKDTIMGTGFVPGSGGTIIPEIARVQSASPGVAVPTVEQLKQSGPKSSVRPPKPKADEIVTKLEGEVNITIGLAKDYQNRLCVPDDGVFGGLDSKTRKALVMVQRFYRLPTDGKLTPATQQKVENLPLCDHNIHKNSWEHLALQDANSVSGDNGIQVHLRTYVHEHIDSLPDGMKLDGVAQNPIFRGGDRLTKENREVIAAIQTNSHDPDAASQDYGTLTPFVSDLIE